MRKIVKTYKFLEMIAKNKKLPKKIKLLSDEIKEEYRILTYNGFWYEFNDGMEWEVVPNYLHLNDKIELLKEGKQ